MDSGWHFALNRSSSVLQEGVCLFDYLAFNPEVIDGEERFPVYLAFTGDGVHFFLQYIEKGSGKTDHFSGCILFLPMNLDRDFRTELSMTLNAAFDDNSFENIPCTPNATKNNTYDSAWFSASQVTGLTVRQLLLDFIFEMEHGSVFQHDPLYDETYAALHEHYLFSAIVAKADYFYYRSFFEEEGGDDRVSRNYLARAERRWIEVLTDSRSDLVFHESAWFQEAVEELSAVYESAHTAVDVFSGTGQNDNEKEKDLKRMAEQSADMAVQWSMSKYRPDAALRIALGNKYKPVVWIEGVLLLALVFLLIQHAACQKLKLFPVFRFCLWCVPILIPTVYLLFSRNSKRSGMVRRHTFMSIMLPRLFAAIAAAWMTVGLGDVIAKIEDTPCWEPYPYAPLVLGVGIIVSVFLLVFLWYSVNRILPYHSTRIRVYVTGWIYALSFIYSVYIGAGLMHLFGGASFLMTDDPYKVRILLVFSFISMFVGVFIQFLVQDKAVSPSDL